MQNNELEESLNEAKARIYQLEVQCTALRSALIICQELLADCDISCREVDAALEMFPKREYHG